MNNKGFTLIEVLCTITIMGIIATIACLNFVNIFDNKEKITNTSKESIITTAACTYIELEENKDLKNTCLERGCKISSNTLISEGLIDSNITNKEVFITIKNVNNTKQCYLEKE